MTELKIDFSNHKSEKKPILNSRLASWGITLGLLLIVLAVTVPLRSMVDSQNLILIYSLVVLIISALTPGYFQGFISAILSTLLFDFFINKPWNAFVYTIKLPITLVIMLIVTIISSGIAAHMKDLTQISRERERNAQRLYKLNEELLHAIDKKGIVEVSNKYLVNQLERSVVFYLDDPHAEDSGFFSGHPNDLDITKFNTKSERRMAICAYDKNQLAGCGTEYSGDRKIYYIPLSTPKYVLGVLGISADFEPLDEKTKSFLKIVAIQISLTLEREYLEEQHEKTLLETEREKMRSSLLRAISHDLRTPLTSILGASNTLIQEDLNLEPRTSKKLVQGIKDQAEWLVRMVENLLTVTKIADQDMEITLVPEAAEEVIAGAVAKVRSWHPDWSIHVKVPEELLVVPMDATLISQVLINLMENSVRSSTPKDLILVNLRKTESTAVFEVCDNGTGISEELLENLFDNKASTVTTKTSDSAGGTGIGLSICRTIIRAHKGKITGVNKPSGGATFSFEIPLGATKDE